MENINWDEVQERQPGEFPRPVPGGYIARIINVEDLEDKQYLRIEWDFEEGDYKGSNAGTFNRAGFWPIALNRSYKPTAQGFFKAFKTSVEMSNRGYTFRNDPPSLHGKLMGVVLGEEEYMKTSGEVGTRLYVYQVRSVKSIRDGDFTVPGLKKLSGTDKTAPERRLSGTSKSAPERDESPQFQPADILEDDDDCPF